MKPSRKGISWIKVGQGIDWIDHYGALVVALLFVVATFLCMIGLNGPWYLTLPRAFFYVLYKSADIKGVSDSPIFPWLQLTRFLILVFASSTIFTKLFHEYIHPYLKRKKVNNRRNHHVIVSYGALGQALARELSDTGKRNNHSSHIVAIDKLNISQYDESNLTILFYDVLQVDISKEANLQFASCVYLMLPDERDNLALLEQIRNLSTLNSQLKVYIRTQSYAMQRLLMDSVGIGVFNQKSLDIRSSNPYQVVARGIVNQYSPDLYAPTDKTGTVSQVVMVIGTSEVAKALVLRFARIGIYSPKGKLKLIWVGEGVADALHELKTNYPALVTDYNEVGYWSHDGSTSEEHFNSLLPPLILSLVNEPFTQAIRNGKVPGIHEPVLPSVIYVCHNSDILNLVEARDLQAAMGKQATIFHKKDREKKKRLILAVQSKSVLGIAQDVHLPFLPALPYQIGEVSLDALFANTIAEDRADELAKGYHAIYAKSNDIDKEWAELRFFLKESNRDVADHLAIKARYAGIDAETVGDCVFKSMATISEADRLLMEEKHEDLAIMEMRRYRAFMFMNGFTHGTHSSQYLVENDKDGKDLDRCLRVNATLLDEALSQIERAKDDDIVDHSMKALAKMRSL